jgi:hypothetical protein
MRTLIKLAVGAAIAGAVATLLMKQRSRARSLEDEAFDDSVGVGKGDVVEVVPVVEVLEVEAVTSGSPDDWYGAQAGDASRH